LLTLLSFYIPELPKPPAAHAVGAEIVHLNRGLLGFLKRRLIQVVAEGLSRLDEKVERFRRVSRQRPGHRQ
jgi:hypothetical protein